MLEDQTPLSRTQQELRINNSCGKDCGKTGTSVAKEDGNIWLS